MDLQLITLYWKQNTVFTSNVQNKQSTIPMNNLAPNEDYTTAISADFTNGTTYRISAVLNYGQDQQPANDDIVGYITAFNLFDPGIVEIEDFDLVFSMLKETSQSMSK